MKYWFPAYISVNILADSMELLWNSVRLFFLLPFWKCNFPALVKLTALVCLQEWLPMDSTNGKHCYQCHRTDGVYTIIRHFGRVRMTRMFIFNKLMMHTYIPQKHQEVFLNIRNWLPLVPALL
jgi:hypothetical protein